MDANKIRKILTKANPSILSDLHKRILYIVRGKFDLDDYEILDARNNITLMAKVIWFNSIGHVEGKLNQQMDEIFRSLRIPSSKFQILLGDDSSNNNDFNLISRS